ncbi:hypothetical protein [Asticcacaulis sp.]|uniref:hypothetical protein n=1 Tax=Asticcacaulis sp. TaxID=1872648 RepID=UPI003F7B7FC9
MTGTAPAFGRRAAAPAAPDAHRAETLAECGRSVAVALLCVRFDKCGAVSAFGLLEDARQRLVIALAVRQAITGLDDISALARTLNACRQNGDRIGGIIDAVRTDFFNERRAALNAQGWIG